MEENELENQIEVIEEKTEVELENEIVYIKIMFSNGKETKITCNYNSTIKIIEKQIRKNVTEENEDDFLFEKFIQLIYNGNLLKNFQTLNSLNLLESTVFHCNISNVPLRTQIRNTVLNLNEHIGDDNIEETETFGFDRLNEQGFSENEIRVIRNQFYSTRQYLLTQRENNEITQRQLQQQEEDWLNEEDPLRGTDTSVIGEIIREDSVYYSNYEGSDFEMLLGIIMGFFFGFINFILFVGSFGFSRKFKYGIMFGVAVNISLSLFNFFQAP